MRQFNRVIFIGALLVFTAVFLLNPAGFSGKGQVSPDRHSQISKKNIPQKQLKNTSGNLYSLMGQSERTVIHLFGRPDRTDATRYGYQWYIYAEKNGKNYMQIGIDSQTKRVSTLYALGNRLNTAPFRIGSNIRNIYQKVAVSNQVPVSLAETKINFELTSDDMQTRPLVKYGDYWVQLNIDHVTGQLMAVRYMDRSVLMLQHPYSLTYSGELPAAPSLSAGESAQIDRGEEREIFDISNLMRIRYHLQSLAWSQSAHLVAYQHSKEMKVKNYFSHDSKWSGNLQTRLGSEKISYEMAGENIAAHYLDAPAVCLGWLNSPDHRRNLLNRSFTELGVGSYQQYYTQDFVLPMNQTP